MMAKLVAAFLAAVFSKPQQHAKLVPFKGEFQLAEKLPDPPPLVRIRPGGPFRGIITSGQVHAVAMHFGCWLCLAGEGVGQSCGLCREKIPLDLMAVLGVESRCGPQLLLLGISQSRGCIARLTDLGAHGRLQGLQLTLGTEAYTLSFGHAAELRHPPIDVHGTLIRWAQREHALQRSLKGGCS